MFNDCLVVMGQRVLDWIPRGLTVSDFFFFNLFVEKWDLVLLVRKGSRCSHYVCTLHFCDYFRKSFD